MHLRKTNAAALPQAAQSLSGPFLDLLGPVLDERAKTYRPHTGSDSFLLSQAFPEGSPTHPAYPTGHGTVAGACITALKFFFDCSGTIAKKDIFEPVEDGLTLRPYGGADAGNLTVNGELHKLAHKISFGHGIHGGIHWRSDTDESILFGEQVALTVLRCLVRQYPEKICVTIEACADGTDEVIEN